MPSGGFIRSRAEVDTITQYKMARWIPMAANPQRQGMLAVVGYAFFLAAVLGVIIQNDRMNNQTRMFNNDLRITLA